MFDTGHLILFISVFIAISEASVNVCQLPTYRRQRLNVSCDFNSKDGCTAMYRRTLNHWKYKTGRFSEIWNAEISGDHSHDGLGGYYLFDPRSFHGKDRLLMPMINYNNICLTFWYNLATAASNINVTANNREIFHNTGPSHGWSKSVIPFNSGSNKPVQIEFEGKKQYVMDIIVVGIDDIIIEIENHPTAMPLKEAVTVVNTPKYNSVISLAASALTTTPTTASSTISTSATVPFMKTTEILTKQATSSTNVTLKAMPTTTAKSSTTADIPTTIPQIITLMALITSATIVIPTSKPVTSRPTTIIPTVLTTISATTSSTAITATTTLTTNTEPTSSMTTNPAITPVTTTPRTLYATSTHTTTVTTTTPMSSTSITPLTTPASAMPNLYKIATKSTPIGWFSTWSRSEYTEATPHREETIGQPHKNEDESKQGKFRNRSAARDFELNFAFSFLLKERFE